MSEPVLRLPHNDSRWVWEIEKPHARILVVVKEVRFNGEHWTVRVQTLPDAPAPMNHGALNNYPGYPQSPTELLQELSRFWEAVTPVDGRIEDLSNPIDERQLRGTLAKEDSNVSQS